MTNTQSFEDLIDSENNDVPVLDLLTREDSMLPTDEEFIRAWKDLRPTQRRYVVARQASRTQTEAARMANVSVETVRKWPQWVHDIADYVGDHRAQTVLRLIQNASLKALEVKMEALDSPDERVRQEAANFILGHTIGKPGATPLIANEGDGPQNVHIIIPHNDRENLPPSRLMHEHQLPVILEASDDLDEEE